MNHQESSKKIATVANQSIAQLALTPLGTLHLAYCADVANAEAYLPDAFLQSQEQGLLQLLSGKIDSRWSLVLKYWRNYIAMYIDQLCHQHALSTSEQIDAIAPPHEAMLLEWLMKIPPMPGAEYATTFVLASIWSSFDSWCRQQISSNPAGITGFFKTYLPAWQQVGRVCFHLAENKQDEAYPFAFMATYAASLTGSRDVQHKPLRHVLQAYAGNANKTALYNVLKPIHDAAEQCDWVREVLDSHDIYHPMAWTPDEAYQLLQPIPQLEAVGLVVKCPNWWKKRAKLKAQVNIGGKKNTLLSANALLDFNVTLALDGESLSQEELSAIYQSDTGLVLLRGQYVEVDQEKLQQALAHWETVQKEA